MAANCCRALSSVMDSPWLTISPEKMHLCPQCSSPRISLTDAQSLDPRLRLWVIEAWCPDCQQLMAGQADTFQLEALADAVEESFAAMLATAKRLEQDQDNWLPPLSN